MVKTAVHVTTIEEWKSVLYIWFNQGKLWISGNKRYSEYIFERGGRYLFLGDYITYSRNTPDSTPFIEYEDFVVQQQDATKKVKPLLSINDFYI